MLKCYSDYKLQYGDYTAEAEPYTPENYPDSIFDDTCGSNRFEQILKDAEEVNSALKDSRNLEVLRTLFSLYPGSRYTLPQTRETAYSVLSKSHQYKEVAPPRLRVSSGMAKLVFSLRRRYGQDYLDDYKQWVEKDYTDDKRKMFETAKTFYSIIGTGSPFYKFKEFAALDRDKIPTRCDWRRVTESKKFVRFWDELNHEIRFPDGAVARIRKNKTNGLSSLWVYESDVANRRMINLIKVFTSERDGKPYDILEFFKQHSNYVENNPTKGIGEHYRRVDLKSEDLVQVLKVLTPIEPKKGSTVLLIRSFRTEAKTLVMENQLKRA